MKKLREENKFSCASKERGKHENRQFVKKHVDELGQLSSMLKQVKIEVFDSYTEFIKTGFTKPKIFSIIKRYIKMLK